MNLDWTPHINSLLQGNRADIVTLDAGELYSAVKQFGLVAIAKEIYSDGRFTPGFWYNLAFLFSAGIWSSVPVCVSTVSTLSPVGGCILSVAVVRNSSLDIRSLKGHRSCHSGVRWTAGWSLPLGFLLSRNYLSWSKEQPLSQGDKNGCVATNKNRTIWKLWNEEVWFLTALFFFSLSEQTSVVFSMLVVFLELLPWQRLCALCAKARSLTSARRITTAKRPTTSPFTTAKEPLGQTHQKKITSSWFSMPVCYI